MKTQLALNNPGIKNFFRFNYQNKYEKNCSFPDLQFFAFNCSLFSNRKYKMLPNQLVGEHEMEQVANNGTWRSCSR